MIYLLVTNNTMKWSSKRLNENIREIVYKALLNFALHFAFEAGNISNYFLQLSGLTRVQSKHSSHSECSITGE